MNVGRIQKISLNGTTAYIAGVIVGDGSISNPTKSKKDRSPDYRITIELVDKSYLTLVSNLIKSFIDTKSKVKSRLRLTKDKEHLIFSLETRAFTIS